MTTVDTLFVIMGLTSIIYVIVDIFIRFEEKIKELKGDIKRLRNNISDYDDYKEYIREAINKEIKELQEQCYDLTGVKVVEHYNKNSNIQGLLYVRNIVSNAIDFHKKSKFAKKK